MKRSKQFAALLLAGIMACSFAACSGKEEKKETTSSPSASQAATAPATTEPFTISRPSGQTTTAKKNSEKKPASTAAPTKAYHGKKMVAITFDDGPGKYTDYLLTELNKRNAKATFFMLGQNVVRYPSVVKRMNDEGFLIGSHTYDHSSLKKMSNTQIQEQLNKTDEAIKKASGASCEYLRPPYGAYKQSQLASINKKIAMWSVDPNDWKKENKSADTVCKNIKSQVKDGSIILVHDIYKTSVDGALKAIDELQKEGYEFVRLDKLIERNGEKPENHRVYRNIPGKG